MPSLASCFMLGSVMPDYTLSSKYPNSGTLTTHCVILKPELLSKKAKIDRRVRLYIVGVPLGSCSGSWWQL